jgi:hypothetical protein
MMKFFNMAIDAQSKAEVVEALSNYAFNYSKKDPEKIIAIIDSNFFRYGSGPDEVVNNAMELRHQLERDFAQSGDLLLEYRPQSVDKEGNVAWCAGNCTVSATNGGEMIRLEGRMSVVLKKVGNEWRFVHIHFSLPDTRQEAGRSVPDRK